jgi:hypothetical protein
MPEPSARTHCPECAAHGPDVVFDLAKLLYSPRVDYFRCQDCGAWWFVPKGADGPATRCLFGNREEAAALEAKKTG